MPDASLWDPERVHPELRPAGAPFGLYIHVPFCTRRCGYCAFVTSALPDPGSPGALGRTDAFVAAATAEIDSAASLIADRVPPLTSIYFGGGTPTTLSPTQTRRLVDAVTDRFDVGPDLEISIEANPDGLAPAQLAELREMGVTRVSFGMQSVRRRVLELLDRTHSPELALQAVRDARRAGFDHVSLDLIYGTPGETEDDWRASLEAVLSTQVDHVSAYALGIESGTKLASRVRRGQLSEPSDDDAADRYLLADSMLRSAGFEWYEISNWSRDPAARCRHNLLYWRNHDWWGVGPGAHSHVAGTRWWNVTDTDSWVAAALGGVGVVAGHEHLDDEQRRIESIMLGVRLAEGLPLPCGRRLVLTTRGRLLADGVVRRLLGGP
ncbi:MAG: radical SAM family heme chaperone HemW [Microthrixaceae bacterium]